MTRHHLCDIHCGSRVDKRKLYLSVSLENRAFAAQMAGLLMQLSEAVEDCQAT